MSRPDLLLHVVYAGRGDALIADFVDEVSPPLRRLILVDGGPTGNRPEQDAIRTIMGELKAPPSPYYRYYISACRDVWGDIAPSGSTFAPNSIWISHPHSDHYGGILQLLWSQLPHKLIDLPGPLFVPNSGAKSNYYNNKVIRKYLDPLGLLKTNGGKNVDQVSVAYPPIAESQKKMLTYSQKKALHPPLPEADWSPDDSEENLDSILMTLSAGRGRDSAVFFTGDNVGWKILETIKDARWTAPIPIYKLQHHGSLRNVQIGQSKATLSTSIYDELRLLCVLLRITRPGHTTGIEWIDVQLDLIVEALSRWWPVSLRQAAVLAELQARTARYKALALLPDLG